MKFSIVTGALMLIASFAMHASPERPTEGVNALSPDGPQVEFTYGCMDFPEVTISISNNQCIEELKALKRIQCRSDWLLRQELVDYYECGAKFSTGDFKDYYENKAKESKKFAQKYNNN